MTDNLNKTFAQNILAKNDKGKYTVPTLRLYPYQWNWDSAFAALGFSTFDKERALVELESLVEGQWENGMIPHIIFRQNDPDYFPGPTVWQPPPSANRKVSTSCYSQPPVLATVLKELLQTDFERFCERGHILFKHALRWHRWWHHERDPHHTGVVGIAHPWESGRDNSPDWDEAMESVAIDPNLDKYQRRDTEHVAPSQRPQQVEYDKYLSILKFGRDNNWNSHIIADKGPFWVADPGINLILLRANRDLLDLAVKFGEQDAQKELLSYIALAENYENSNQGLNALWNPKVNGICAKNLRTDKFCNNFSNASALIFYANFGDYEKKTASLKQIHDILRKCNFAMPSTDPAYFSYEPQRYWRGPIWLVMNYMIAKGLSECSSNMTESTKSTKSDVQNSMKELGNRIARDSLELIKRSGYYEYFNPETGTGIGGNDFTWTAAIRLIYN